MAKKSKERPDWLLYRARDGVIETRFTHDKAGGHTSFIEEWIMRSDAVDADSTGSKGYRILDSFASDSLNTELFRLLVQRATNDHPLQVLLLDPTSQAGLARAQSIDQDASLESRKGLEFLLRAINSETEPERRKKEPQIRDADSETLTTWIQELGQNRHIELRFCSVSASGPLYFFKSILLCGRFSAGVSATELPWSLVIDDPRVADDMYDVASAEFSHLWGDDDEHRSECPYTVFLSYSHGDERLASELSELLTGNGVKVYNAREEIRPGEQWEIAIREHLLAASELVVLISQKTLESPWVWFEVGAFWDTDKTITPALVGVDVKDLPDFMRRSLAVDVSDTMGKNALLETVRRRAGKEVRRG